MDSVPSSVNLSTDPLTSILARWKPVGRSGLLPTLLEAQEAFGWLSQETLARIAAGLGVPLSEVFGVADFYAHLYTHPVGKTIVRVCDDVPCYLAGSEKVCAAVAKRLQIQAGETTADGAFTFELSPCLGHCDHAPALMIGPDVHTNVDADQVAELLKNGNETRLR